MADGDRGPGLALTSCGQTPLSTFLSSKEVGLLKAGEARQEAPAALGAFLTPSFLPPCLASHSLHGGGLPWGPRPATPLGSGTRL